MPNENSSIADALSPFAFSVAEIEKLLEVDQTKGLHQAEAAGRLERNGRNAIATAAGRSVWAILFGQIKGIIFWLLVVAAVVAWFTDGHLEAVSIVIVLLLNVIIGFAIEWQASRSLNALRQATRTTSHVRRDGSEKIIDSEELVVGDIIVVTAGSRVPADALLIEAVSLQADESSLTGESEPADKKTGVMPSSTPLAERFPMIYFGTNIVRGHALAVVTSTGAATEIGRVGKLLDVTDAGQTPLEKKLAELGQRLVYIVLGIAAVIMLTGYLRGDEWWLMVEVSISLAVAAVPEGLPAVTTLILGLGVLRMARRNALIRRLSAVETLGSTTVICTDKTGTLTENRMTVREYQMADGTTVLLESENGKISPTANLTSLLRVSVLCNESKLDPNEEDADGLIGDPTETALLVAASRFVFDTRRIRASHRTIHERPFDAVAKRMTTVSQAESGGLIATMKGAPAVVLKSCTTFITETGETSPLDDDNRRRLLKINDSMADRALRVLAFAEKTIDGQFNAESIADSEERYVFLGFAGMSDPPREGVSEAVEAALAAGIRVVMLTGDQINTARAIAHELGLSSGDDIFALHSDDLKDSNSNELAKMAKNSHVFARVTPEDKLRIVEALQNAGEIVAVTGDGVNDAPALRRADVGIAMGKRGTEVAKEAADIVLTDDNFSTIMVAVEGGRTIYSNIIKFVHWMFSTNLAEVIVIFVPIAAGYPLPLLPLQILWGNILTDVFPALALAFEPASSETMKRPPLSPQDSLLSKKFLWMISWEALMLASIVIGIYLWALSFYGEGTHARTVALLAMVVAEIAHLYNCRSRTRSAFEGFFTNPYIFGATAIVIFLQFLAFYFPPLMRVLDTVSPNAIDYLVVLIAVAVPIVIVEIVKFFMRRR